MQLRVAADRPWDVPADVLAIPIVGQPLFEGVLGEIDRRTGRELSGLVALREITDKRFSTQLASAGELRAERVLTVAAGPADELDRETGWKLGAAAIRRLAGRPVRRVAVWLDPLAEVVGTTTAAELFARGIVEGGFEPRTLYRPEVEEAPPALDELILIVSGTDSGSIRRAAERGVVMGEGSVLVRTLGNRAANEVSPEVLAEEARAIAEANDLRIDVLDEQEAADLGMGLFLAVGRGSDNPPRMIVLRSGPEDGRDALGRQLAIVGKGVCFDSGGISIKSADRMEEMKMDKLGACTVIGAIATVARLAPGTPLLAIAPAVENMPGPHSTRPGDVVRAMNGQYVDITNTDAEGRLILADAMTYAERLGATHVVDVATLTGAVARALGHLVTGGFGAPDDWFGQVAEAAARAGERLWRLPLVEDYWVEMESWYGDMVNSAGGDGGLIRSALFLRRFVTGPWVHLDIAGTAYVRKAAPYTARGATGASHATLVELALAGAAG